MKSQRPGSLRGRACSPWPLCLLLSSFVVAGSCTSTHRAIPSEIDTNSPGASVVVGPAESADLIYMENPGGSDLASGLNLRNSRALLAADSMELPEWATIPAARGPELAADLDAPEFRFQRNDSMEVHGSIWFYFGTKWMEDSKFWSPIDDPTVGGFDVMYEFVKEFPFEVEFGFQYSKTEEEDPEGNVREKIETYEIYIGLRKSWDIDWFATHLYVGTGLAYNWIEAELQDGSGGTAKSKDHDFGIYLHTGFYIPLGTYLVAGIDLRGLLTGKYDLGQNTVGANYVQATVFAGFDW